MRLWKHLRLLCKSLISTDYRDYRYVRNLQVFDVQYYFSFIDDKELLAGDPLLTYFLHWRRSLHGFTQVCRSWRQLPDPHPLFDTAFYLKKHFPHGLRRNPFAHYLRKGWKRGWWPSPYFDPDLYRQRTDWDPHRENPLTHYTRTGAESAVSPSDFFDIDWYIDKTQVLQPARNWIIRHYKLYGSKEKKSPIPVFDPPFYLQQCSVGEAARRDPLVHYVTVESEGAVRPSEWFDPCYYRKRYLRGSTQDSPLAHYLRSGVFSGNYTDSRIAELPYKPTISIIVPVHDTNPHFLNCCIRSVLYQAYPHWQLCLVDDCSSNEEIPELLRQWAARDDRISVAFHQRNTGISGATATGVDLAVGDYLGFLDHDDELTLDCLYRVVHSINETGASLLYTDEDLVGDDGSRQGVFHKPDFNRELLFSHNYVTHFVVIKRELYRKIGAMSGAYDGAQDFDLVLRATEQTEQVVHIPHVLYHWRTAATSTSINHEKKPYAHEAGKRALAESLARRGIAAEVVDNHLNFHYRVVYRRTAEPRISVLVWSPGSKPISARHCEAVKAQAGYDNFEVLVLPQPGAAPISRPPAAKAVAFHEAIAADRADYVVLIGSSPQDISEAWLHHLAAPLLQDPDLGIVCGRVAYGGQDGRSLAIPDPDDHSDHHFGAALAAMSRHFNGLHNPQLVRCCDWSICVFSRALYQQIGGFDPEKFPSVLTMHDFSLSVFQTGKKILYVPDVVVDLGTEMALEYGERPAGVPGEKEVFQQKWRDLLARPDPFYNTGRLIEHQIDDRHFQRWLTGREEECLDETAKLH
ncbi:glycosyltransferase family 2 protein [Desulfofustis glycolicus]|uniref:Glycosyltransferase involved in cell wall bisynthesis n=1 Tax=Desulfofustis glycolicus DSM 9705 TaxID=1121409 RepID=A0A1M5Y386_9BACT|nr:glycosyltransferase [Desulfofustis glycolicus]MCB2214870.1 glycosyltransferase [Desulfobulbaceae bacterium]SHI06497.1 Glycosyltransferase involved in cell wall bisynthesis [Desulfofustis glycolicus DSM 9705]